MPKLTHPEKLGAIILMRTLSNSRRDIDSDSDNTYTALQTAIGFLQCVEDFTVEQLIAKLPSITPVDRITVLISDRPETSLPHAYLRRRSIGNTDTVKLDHSSAGLQIS